MRAIIKFEEFIRKGIVKKQTPDKSRAKFLIEESEQNYKYLLKLVDKIGIDKFNANDYIKKCYDVLMEIIRANMLIKGYNASGLGAHEAEVSYLVKIGIEEKYARFANQMRFFRNGMLYYGTILDEEYAKKVIQYTKIMRKRLIRLYEDELKKVRGEK